MFRGGVDRATEIERLAALESINYEVVRVDQAKRLGIRPRILDQEVAKKRRALGAHDWQKKHVWGFKISLDRQTSS
jgi:hypothetical protein